MKKRTRTAILGLLLFIPFMAVGGWPMTAFILVVATLSLWEFLRMMKIRRFSFEGILAFLMMLSIYLPRSGSLGIAWPLQPIDAFYVGVIGLFVLMVYFPQKLTFLKLCTLSIASLYVGIGYHYLIMTRDLGLPILLYIMGIIWVNDSCAYITGIKWGKNKLAPKISPNKTIEGALGGIGGALVFTCLLEYIAFKGSLSFLQAILLTVILSLCGQFGDLIESSIKRHFSVKDSGNLLPGHGGLLDRFDSMLVVLPVFHYFLALFF